MSDFSFDVTSQPLGSWSGADAAGKLATQAEVIELGKILAQSLQDEFSSGGHNRTGETVDSLKIQVGPMGAEIIMSGGAWFVEHGFPGHYIEADQAEALHWEADDKFDEGYARPGIWVSGYEGDPFVERALKDLDVPLESAMKNIADKIFDAYVAQNRGLKFSTGSMYPEDDAIAEKYSLEDEAKLSGEQPMFEQEADQTFNDTGENI